MIHNILSTIVQGLSDNMEVLSAAFCLNYCNYDVKKSRETTARVAVWRDFNILRSYTLECSYSGCDRGFMKVSIVSEPLMCRILYS
jgi:hypothetical protein